MFKIDKKFKLSDLIGIAIATARAFAGDVSGLAVEGIKHRKTLMAVIGGLFFFIVVMVALLTSIPSFMMQAIVPIQDKNADYKAISLIAESQLEITKTESISLWSSILSLFGVDDGDKTGEEVVAEISPDIDYEVVLILYNVKYGGYGMGELLDIDNIKTIAKMFMKESDGEVTQESFESVLNDLDVTEMQHTIAMNMYEQLTYTQITNPNDIDYGGNVATNEPVEVTDIKFKNGSTDVVYYNQGDSRWGSIKYGKYDGIKVAGCGPTSLAIVVASFTGKNIIPPDVAKWSVDNGYRVEGSGSAHALIPNGAKHYGLNVEGATYREQQKVIDALADGKLVIAIMGKGHFTSSGHFIVLRGVTSDGKILVADPASVRKSNQEWDSKIVFGEARKSAGAGGAFWIISK